ncbi:MAG: hypothetical protein L3J10_01785 [Sulfurimonas sp.]|nr:hypothetical protein [Sulfurimonas sp.]
MKFFRLIIFFFLICSTIIHARYQDRGASGAISFLYDDQSYDLDGTIIEQKKLTQEYELDYDGHIYNPNLFSYKIDTLLRFDNITQDGSVNSGKTKENSEDFAINTSFLRSSKFPFRLYYRTSNRPRTSINSGQIINLNSKNDNYGLSGKVKFDEIEINYDASESSNTDNTEDKLFDRTILRYESSVRYKTDMDSVMLKYSHTTTDTQEYSSGTTNNTSEGNDNISLTHSSILSEDITISSSFGYATGTEGDSSIMTGNFNIGWKPDADYQLSADTAISSTEFNVLKDVNSTQTTLEKTDTFDINEMFIYNITKNLLFTQTLNYFSYEGPSSNGDTAVFSLSGTYNNTKQLTPQRRLSYTSSLKTTFRQQNSSSTSQDTNTTTVTNESTSTNNTSYSIIANLSEELPSINSRLHLNAGYIGTRSTEDSTDKYDIGFSLLSVYNNFRNVLNAEYSSPGDTTTITFSDKLYYTRPVGIKGNLSSNIGIDITETSGSTVVRKSEKLSAGFKFRYRFFRRLNFLTAADFNKDLGYNTLNYSYKAELKSVLGLTTISISYDYNYSYAKSVSDEAKSTRQVLLAKIRRTF